MLHNIYGNNIKTIIARLEKDGDIKTGELRFRINFMYVMPAGEAIFAKEKAEEYKGSQVYHLAATAQSLPIYSMFFKSYAVVDSYIDMQQLSPVLFRQKLVVTGRDDLNREIAYDQKEGIMSIAGVRRQILPNTQDPLSAIFNIRRMDFNKVKEFEVNINTNQKNYILKGKAYPKDISINNKTYKIVLLRAEISRRDKNPYHKSKITMVLLRQKEGSIPVFIKVFASGALINARLVDIK
jgi:hypothetical protein